MQAAFPFPLLVSFLFFWMRNCRNNKIAHSNLYSDFIFLIELLTPWVSWILFSLPSEYLQVISYVHSYKSRFLPSHYLEACGHLEGKKGFLWLGGGGAPRQSSNAQTQPLMAPLDPYAKKERKKKELYSNTTSMPPRILSVACSFWTPVFLHEKKLGTYEPDL